MVVLDTHFNLSRALVNGKLTWPATYTKHTKVPQTLCNILQNHIRSSGPPHQTSLCEDLPVGNTSKSHYFRQCPIYFYIKIFEGSTATNTKHYSFSRSNNSISLWGLLGSVVHVDYSSAIWFTTIKSMIF